MNQQAADLLRPAEINKQPPDTNMKPSLVVQQQRQLQMGIFSANQLAKHPSPDGSASNMSNQSLNDKPSSNSIMAANELSGVIQYQQQQQQSSSSNYNHSQTFDQNGLVLPKRILPSNLNGIGHQPIIRDLNRELKFNQIRGKNVLDQKSELKKAMEKLEENKRKKEAEQERLSRRSSLELRLEERAGKLAKETSASEVNNNSGISNQSSETKSVCKINSLVANFDGIKSINR